MIVFRTICQRENAKTETIDQQVKPRTLNLRRTKEKKQIKKEKKKLGSSGGGTVVWNNTRVTRRVCEKMAQNVAQPVF
jgi:hypothetical protein